jgi:hypothetical protein
MARFFGWMITLAVLGAVVFVGLSNDPDARRIRRRVDRAVAELTRPERAEPWSGPALAVPTDDTARSEWVPTPVVPPRDEIPEPRATARSFGGASSDFTPPDTEAIARDTVSQFLPGSGRAFDAGQRFLDAAPGSSASRQAQGELLRESAATTGRLIGRTAREAVGTVSDPSFLSGLLGHHE